MINIKISKVVSNNEFKRMISYQPYAENRRQQQEMKLRLLDPIEKAYGDNYYRLKKGTRQAIDMMCWLASERGFVFAGDEYLGDRHDISDRTIRNVAKTLREKGLIITIYRRSTKHNGRGCPIHLFVDHPYFEHWTNFLQLDYQTDFQADFQAEKNEIPCGSKEEPTEKMSTYQLPLKTFIKNNKRKEDSLFTADFASSYVPERFILAVQPFFGEAKEIYRLWGKVCLAHKISRLDIPVEDLLSLVIQTFKGSVFAYKQKRVKKAFTGYFFGSLRNVFAAEKRREVFHSHSTNPLFYNFLKA